MPKQYPLEALLRTPVEWWSCGVCVVAALLFWLCSSNLLLFSPINYLVSLSLGLLGIKRFLDGHYVIRYQNNLRKLPLYAVSSKQIPVDNKKQFLGKGFRWLPIHTQRLFDCQQNPKFLKNKSKSQKKLSDVGGNSALHGVELHEENVWMNLADRVGHTLVLGTTRVGKTRLLELLVSQDIRRGDVVIVIDPKGDGDLLRRIVFEAKACGREDDVIIFHLGFPDISARYNPIGNFARITEVANRVAGQLPNSGESAAFREFGWRFVNIIAKALVALGKRPDYKQIQRYILSVDQLLLDYVKQWLPKVNPNWENAVEVVEKEIDERSLPIHMRTRSRRLIAIVNYIQKNNLYDSIADGLCSAFNYDKTYFDKITASLLPLIEKLTTGKVADLISPDYFDLEDNRPIFDWLQVIRGKKIVYVGLDALSDATVAAAVGNSMFADLCSIAGQLYKYGVEGGFGKASEQSKVFYPIDVHSDEFNELIGDEFIPLLNKAGGSGVRVTAYTQTWSDVEAKLGNRAKAGQVGGNLNTLICLRVLEEETARLLTNKLPQNVPIKTLIPVSSANDSSNVGSNTDFSSHNEDRINTTEVPLLTPGDLIQLPKGQAYCLLNGGQLWKIRMPLPKDDLSSIAESVETMATNMQNQYQTGVQWLKSNQG